jgi:hypothetical protein
LSRSLKAVSEIHYLGLSCHISSIRQVAPKVIGMKLCQVRNVENSKRVALEEGDSWTAWIKYRTGMD